MVTINIDCSSPPRLIDLGKQGENLVRQVMFDVKSFIQEFGIGNVTLIVARPNDISPYPVSLTLDGTTVTWDITSIDTAKDGTGQVQLSYYVEEQIKKTVIYKIKISKSIVQGNVPLDPYASYLDQMITIHNQVTEEVAEATTLLTQTQKLFEDGAIICTDLNNDGNIVITFPIVERSTENG